MRKMILCAIALMSIANSGFSQINKNHVEKLVVRTFDEKGQLTRNDIYEGNQATAFDIPEFILDNYLESRVVIHGTFSTDLKVDHIQFDSQQLDEKNGLELCQSETTVLKPIIGVVAETKDDMNGVNINRVIKEGSAEELGLEMNDVILTFDGLELMSHCDLKSAVQQTEIGTLVPITIVENGNIVRTEIKIGALMHNTITYKFCDVTNLNPTDNLDIPMAVSNSDIQLSVYPNPSSDISYIQFKSDETEEVLFYVFDMYGNTVHKEVVNNFSGNLRLQYNFNQSPDGTYLMVIEQNDKIYKKRVVFAGS